MCKADMKEMKTANFNKLLHNKIKKNLSGDNLKTFRSNLMFK